MGAVLYLLFALLCAMTAVAKGRSGIAWFFLGLFFNVIALVLLFVLPNPLQEERRHEEQQERYRGLDEELRNQRLRQDVHRAEVDARLDAHDTRAGVDTRPKPLAIGAQTSPAVPPLPAASQAQWYYEYQGQARGPESASVLKLRFLRGELHPGCLVWRSGLPDWVPADTQADFSA